jgi:hypothetical protein
MMLIHNDRISAPPTDLRRWPGYTLQAGAEVWVLEGDDEDRLVGRDLALYGAYAAVLVEPWTLKRPIPLLINVRRGRDEWACEPARIFATRRACELEAEAWNRWLKRVTARMPIYSNGATRWEKNLGREAST